MCVAKNSFILLIMVSHFFYAVTQTLNLLVRHEAYQLSYVSLSIAQIKFSKQVRRF